MVITFLDFLMFDQIFPSQQMKIISNKHGTRVAERLNT